MALLLVFLVLMALAPNLDASNTCQLPENMILPSLPPTLTEVDFIIVGGGTAGCIIAARLSDAQPSSTILVIEAGPESHELPSVIYPALYRKNISPVSTTLRFYFASPEPQLANRSVPILAGKTLGGGSAVNLLMYARGQRLDFTGWGARGWSADELLPFLKQSETYHGLGPVATHGDKGPINVSSGKYVGSILQEDFISGFNQVGYPTAPDIQDLVTANAVGPTYRIVSPASGRRQDTAYTYLYPRISQGKSSKISVLVETQVVRVLFDGEKRATGVEFQTKSNAAQIVNAKKLVVLSAGSMGTPPVLERSGVGAAAVLGNAGISVVSDLPGVGGEYQDHQMLMISYKAELSPSENVDSVLNGVLNATELIEKSADILSWNGVDASAKIRPTKAEIQEFKPALRKLWDEQYANEPSKPFGIMVVYAGIMDLTSQYPTNDRYFTLTVYNPYARSRGHLHITGSGLQDALDFKTGILSDAEQTDIQVLTWLYKKQRQVAKRMACQRGQVSTGPDFPSGSSASNELALDPTKEDPTYTSADDQAIEDWIKKSVATPFHSLGTSKMAEKSKLGVVNDNLDVYGVKGLKVADLSIAPGNVAGNTMNAAVVIGEKAADIINTMYQD